MIEVIVLLSTALTGGLIGYMWVDRRDRLRIEKDMGAKTEALNLNIENLAKVAREFNEKASGFEERLASMEFSVKGFSDIKRR